MGPSCNNEKTNKQTNNLYTVDGIGSADQVHNVIMLLFKILEIPLL